MKRPLPLRLLPDGAKTAAWGRWYHRRLSSWLPLFESAALRFAPGITMDLVPGDIISSAIAFTGFYELGLSRLLWARAQRGGLMLDVGANMGYFSLLWAAANPASRVLAFEASVANVPVLRRNVDRNAFTERIRVVPRAVGRARGTMAFDAGPADQTGWGGFSMSPGAGATVDVVRLDDEIEADASVALMKIDIEGAEAWALEGASGLLARRRIELIWFEQNRPRQRSLGIADDAARRLLADHGYVVTCLDNPASDLSEWEARPRR